VVISVSDIVYAAVLRRTAKLSSINDKFCAARPAGAPHDGGGTGEVRKG
jgi:hypothetical protein